MKRTQAEKVRGGERGRPTERGGGEKKEGEKMVAADELETVVYGSQRVYH